jgi:hypothetical protein
VAGLLGITIIGAVLRARQGADLRHGANQGAAYLNGYHAGLAVTVILIAAGAVISYVALRRIPKQAAGGVVAAEAAELSGSAEPALQATAARQRPGTQEMSASAESEFKQEPALR